ncbi:glutamate synthase [Erysipelatoclostridium sp. An173]|uniref:glutamate synthase subunit beta n=1 Tax=Erysipelatoclostridium sp. An173 TaxID=1965571 RepID=UPI000B396053|nr:glutamate synthase subunit beta [Erysipelatoclostridium sp. An173]OUP72365.1 glutamate synthase [Erysipelatoclostridium sp. An173]
MGKPTGFLEIERKVSEEVEPQKRISNFKEFHIHLNKDQQACQGARCMDCGVPFCQSGKMLEGMVSGCPLNNLIPEWNDLVYHNNYKQALSRLLKTNNFPEFTSRVCPALCEAACTCGLNGEPVTVKENEHGIIEDAYEKGLIKPCPPKQRIDKRIAIIGSGPAGLAAADQLNKRGYQVTVYERDDRIGGLLMYGIPNMKLEKDVIDCRVAIMKAEGVIFKTNCGIETKEQVKDLLNQYDRVILACGSRKARNIEVPGRQGKGIYYAVDYLTMVTKSLLNSDLKDQKYVNTKDKNVLVIGGGDTGNDCVATAIRLGCKSVMQLEMMPELPEIRSEDNPWPQWPRIKKTDYGQEEAIAIFGHDPRCYQTTVKEFILDKKGNVKQAILISLEPKENKETKRVEMVPVSGSEKTIDVDLVLIAAGFIGCEDHVAKAFGIKVAPRGNVLSDQNYQTNIKNLYVAGDMRRGQSLVVWAIKEGREVARSVDIDLMGYSNL